MARGTAPDLMICNYVYEHVEDGTSPVSYTHLDVYKRQVLSDNAVVLADTIVEKVLQPLLIPVITLVLLSLIHI